MVSVATLITVALIAATVSLVAGILIGHRLAGIDARIRAKTDTLDAIEQMKADLVNGHIEIDGWKFEVVGVEFPEDKQRQVVDIIRTDYEQGGPTRDLLTRNGGAR